MNSALRPLPIVIILLLLAVIFAIARFGFGEKKLAVSNSLPNAPDVEAPVVAMSAADATGHQKMIDAIGSLNKRRSAHEYFGDEKASQLRQNLAAITGPNSQMQQFSNMYKLGVLELRLGREEEAITLLSSAVKMLPKMSGKITAKDAYDVIFQTGVAYMRLGESQNCCLHNNPDSCVFRLPMAESIRTLKVRVKRFAISKKHSSSPGPIRPRPWKPVGYSTWRT